MKGFPANLTPARRVVAATEYAVYCDDGTVWATRPDGAGGHEWYECRPPVPGTGADRHRTPDPEGPVPCS